MRAPKEDDIKFIYLSKIYNSTVHDLKLFFKHNKFSTKEQKNEIMEI